MRESYNDVDGDADADDSEIDEVDDYDTPYVDQYNTKRNVYGSTIPKPIDLDPSLSQCQPCDCKKYNSRPNARYSRKLLKYEPTSDEENDEEILREEARIKMAKAKMMKAKKGKKN